MNSWANKLIILDRDGVINDLLLINNQIDSPQSIDQIKVFPWIPNCLKEINNLGYNIGIATNQPAAAKGKNTIENLNLIHNTILDIAKSSGAEIISSNICFHRAEDLCICRKPKTKMLQDAFNSGNFDKSKSWMVGDKNTDIQAGHSFGVSTALLTSMATNENDLVIQPNFRGKDLRDFVDFLKS
jgi:histidinol-phosphate phosphatase family protein